MKIEMKQLFWFGVYRDYYERIKVGQLKTTVDGLSCEILADPGMIEISAATKKEALAKGKKLADVFDCSILETDFGRKQVYFL